MLFSALRTLEFNRIRDALAREALTPLGRGRALELEPAVDPARVRAQLDHTAEALGFTRDGGSLSLSAPEDLPATLEALAIGGQPLDPLALLGLARFFDSVDQIASGVRHARSAAPLLAAIGDRVPSFEHETRAIRRAIEPSGDVSDDASPALRDIREQLRRHRAKLRAALDALTRGRDAAKYLQDQIVTDRNGRYVVVVRAEHRMAIPGIVHGSSASGASLYVEPLTTVELNNDVVQLVEREKAEVQRILLALTDAIRARGDDLEAVIEAAADIDELQAKTRLAERLQGVAPELSADGRIEFRGARHPLLVLRTSGVTPEVGAAGVAPEILVVVPSDLLIVPPCNALVISGPNTGGKTVALKAVGLLAVMAQSGLLIPVEPGSRFTPFTSVFADIGDDQSIAASLSTFSARIANLVAIERELALPALVLLDEVGSGTDPAEGGALGAAVINHLRGRGAIVIATTHDDALKSYAATTEGVAAAAFGFDADTYAPSYSLVYGAPGRSLALEIAERLGLPASVIADARARRSGRESLLAAHLARVDRELAAIGEQQRAVEAERDALRHEQERLLQREARLTEREAVLKRRLDDKLNDKLREARAEVDRVVGQLKQQAETLAARAGQPAPGRGGSLSTGQIGALRADARAALGTIGDSLEPGARDEPAPLTDPPDEGDSVFVPALGANGVVRSVSGNRVEVEIRGKRLRVKLNELRRPESHGAAPPGRSTAPARANTLVVRPVTPAATRELVLVGSTVDEALERAAKFIDDALLADEKELRVVHGRGTGRLREALRTFFKEHPLVAQVRSGGDGEGGDAVTMVELRE
jgi:DNA mismatch repair protein MutS2